MARRTKQQMMGTASIIVDYLNNYPTRRKKQNPCVYHYDDEHGIYCVYSNGCIDPIIPVVGINEQSWEKLAIVCSFIHEIG